MTARAIIAIISVCSVAIGGLFGTILSILMIEEVGRTSQDSRINTSIPLMRWASLQTLREYRKSCPRGKLHIYLLASYALATAGSIGFAVFMVMAYQPLVVRITSPSDEAVFVAPASIVIIAETSEGNSSVSRVDFYQGAALIDTSTSAPYSVTWNNVSAGSYSITARATNERGTTTTSEAVSIRVHAP